MSQKLLIFLFAMASITMAAQTSALTYKGKSYPATNSWDFISENYALSGVTSVQVAKSEKGGILMLAVETTNPAFVISGTVYVFLTDNTSIICSDKGNREISGNKIISYYQFAPTEMNKLKTTEIQSIHFNIKGNATGFNSQIGNFTAVNRKNYFATTYDKTKKSYNTAVEIAELYK